MKTKFLLSCLLAAILLPLTTARAYPPAPASQAAVNAGTEPYLYVTPKTLSGSGYRTVGQFNLVRDFGATNDGVVISGLTSSGTTLTATFGCGVYGTSYFETNAPFRAGDVGKVIMLYEGGADRTNCFTTTIAAYTSGTQVTLASTPARTAVKFGVFGSSNDTAIQNALNVVSNYSADIYCPAGIYLITGAPKGTNNAQLIVPPVGNINNQGELTRVLRFRGDFRPKITQAVAGQAYVPNLGSATFWSTITNLGGGSMLDCRNFLTPVFATQLGFNNPRVEFERLGIAGAWDNNGSLLNLAAASSAAVKENLIWSGYNLYNTPKATKTNSMGLLLPTASSSGGVDVMFNEIIGFSTGASYGEHTYAFGNLFGDCRVGLNVGRIYQFATNGNSTTYFQGGGHAGFWYGCDFENVGSWLYNDCGAQMVVDVTAEGENFVPGAVDYYWPATNLFEVTSSLGGRMVWRSSTSSGPNFNADTHINSIRLPGAAGELEVTNNHTYFEWIGCSNIIGLNKISSSASEYVWSTLRAKDTYQAIRHVYQDFGGAPMYQWGQSGKTDSFPGMEWYSWPANVIALALHTNGTAAFGTNVTMNAALGFPKPANFSFLNFTNGMQPGDWKMGNSNGWPFRAWIPVGGSVLTATNWW